MAYKLKNGRVMKSLTLEASLYEDFCFHYSENVFRLFILNCLYKANSNKDFFEFCMFDDIDDFLCNRSIVKNPKLVECK